MKKKSIKKLMNALGLGLVLAHNKVEIDKNYYDEVKKKLSEAFDGDEKEALKQIEKQYTKLISEIKGEGN